eukprot:gene14589-biopygen15030
MIRKLVMVTVMMTMTTVAMMMCHGCSRNSVGCGDCATGQNGAWTVLCSGGGSPPVNTCNTVNTAAPSDAPSSSPSAAPSTAPTCAPTSAPTSAPTEFVVTRTTSPTPAAALPRYISATMTDAVDIAAIDAAWTLAFRSAVASDAGAELDAVSVMSTTTAARRAHALSVTVAYRVYDAAGTRLQAMHARLAAALASTTSRLRLLHRPI